ncbi:hypothetical protein MJ588_04725 [Klebsiella pneumoniae]|nr:hypothetical protein MJ588_04725 [Klebsiella pneumoniae]
MRESGVVERLSDTVQKRADQHRDRSYLGLSVGAKLVADKFLQPQSAGDPGAGGDRLLRGDRGQGYLMAKLMERVQPAQKSTR